MSKTAILKRRQDFWRSGSPADLPVTVASRALLVAVCSGLVLMVGGVLVLAWRPPVRLVGIVVALLGVAVATLVHPSVTFLAVQSGMVGVVLTVSIVVMQRLIEGRRGEPAVYVDPNGRAALAPGSTLSRAAVVGSDDPTAIRVRSVSTMDFVPAPPAPPVKTSETASSRSGPAARGGAAP